MFDIFAISASGMSAQRLRMNVIASNLANVETTRTADGGAYRRRDVVFASARETGFAGILDDSIARQSVGVRVTGIVEDARAMKHVYEPSHPDADTNGYVTYPNINVVEEMVNMIAASRSFEANVTAFKSTRDMALRAIEIAE